MVFRNLGKARDWIGVCSPFISYGYAWWLVRRARSGVKIWVVTSVGSEKWQQKSVRILEHGRFRYGRNWLLIVVLTLVFGVPSFGLLAPLGFVIGWRRKKKVGSYPLYLKSVFGGHLHAKLYVVDGVFAASGSLNYTKSGFWDNVEHIDWFEGEDAKPLVKQFKALWDNI
ncbi:MAG: hypothetical protein HYU39_01845 [Thaumarchaeota archaeon]|nr:hypothetical protein [Nitrososphaerota archaeon]